MLNDLPKEVDRKHLYWQGYNPDLFVLPASAASTNLHDKCVIFISYHREITEFSAQTTFYLVLTLIRVNL